jgi:hypothetical protein
MDDRQPRSWADGAQEAQEQPGVPAAQPGTLGSRAHIRETLERVRGTVRAAGERRASSASRLTEAAARLEGSAEALRVSQALRAQMRASVTAYARHLRASGEPSERVVVLVKSAFAEAMPPELDVLEVRAVMADAVRWSIEAYYGG